MSGTAPGDLGAHIERLAQSLRASGSLTERTWHDALFAVPRHLFLPAVAWAQPDRPDGGGHRIDRDHDPAAWWDAAYSETVIITQVADGAGEPGSGVGPWTSSCSAPGIVVRFLEQLSPLDHHRVLEIGTGTGWTAALLAWRVGAHNVVSVEIDAGLADRAADRLKAAGWAPRLVTGDGAAGVPDAAPYDRVHVTCGVDQVPYAWIEQTRPGGVIVCPWSPGWTFGHLTRLTVTGEGTAVGGFAGPAGFMMLRSQRRPFGAPETFTEGAEAAERSMTRLDPRTVLWDSPGAALAITGLVPGVRSQLVQAEGGGCDVWMLENRPAGAWAMARFVPGRAEFAVEQCGDRHLWDEVEAAYLQWLSWGRPPRERFGLTVTRDGARLWLDTPDRPISAPAPGTSSAASPAPRRSG